jgi:very-short-patch-repair endonuclease
VVHDLRALLGPDGVARTVDLSRKVDRHTVGAWVARGRLLRPHPGVVVLPDLVDDWRTRALAAVLATDGTLSHTSALALWRRAPKDGPIHVSVPARRRALRSPGLVVHRVQELVSDELGGLPVTPLPRALVDTWGLALRPSGGARAVEQVRGAVIDSLRDGQVRVAEVRAALVAAPAVPGRGELHDLLGLVERGCQSELEIWGVREVLEGPGMPQFVQQHPVRVAFGTVHLDAAVPELKLAVELDGAAFHGSAAARERDTRRDVALAALGWVVLRFSYRRLRREPEACRREIAEVCRARAALVGLT